MIMKVTKGSYKAPSDTVPSVSRRKCDFLPTVAWLLSIKNEINKKEVIRKKYI